MQTFREAVSIWLWCVMPYGALTIVDFWTLQFLTPRVNATVNAMLKLQAPPPACLPQTPDEAPYWLALFGFQILSLATATIAVLHFIEGIANGL